MISKQTLSCLYQNLPDIHSDIDIFLIRYDLDEKIIFGPLDNTIKRKHALIIKYLAEHPGIRDSMGNDIAVSVVNEVLKRALRYDSFDEETNEFRLIPDLYHFLRLDGYDINFTLKELVPSLPNDIKIPDKVDKILSVLDRYGFSITKGHYLQAKSNYTQNNFAALNGQLRTYTESLFMDMATYIKNLEQNNININAIMPINATQAMIVLKKCNYPILDDSLNEWDGQGNGYIQAFWKRLHPQGSHPGLPVFDEAVYRFQLVILNTHLLVCRFEKMYT